MKAKKLFTALAAFVAAAIMVGCDDKENSIDAPNYGDFVFENNTLTIEVNDATTSFCLDGHYTAQPDVEVAGQVWMVVSCDAEAAKLFPNYTAGDNGLLQTLVKFEEGEDGLYHYEVSFNPADVTADATVTYTVINGEYNYNDLTAETLVSIENKSEIVVTLHK